MRTVTVTGHGQTSAVPDSAVVRVSAVHRATGVADALAGAGSAAQTAAETARQHTAPERVASSSVSIWPTSDQQGSPTGYEATHSLTIRCAGIEATDALLSALVAAVGDRLRIEGVSLEVDDPSSAQTSARAAAYADAVARATQLAELAGAQLGDPQEVAEGGVVGAARMALKGAALADAGLEPGEQAVTASVTVTFQLR